MPALKLGLGFARGPVSSAPLSPPLDSLSALAAYSTRRLRTAYSGPAIRVRRSSDNTEQDIGFSGNDLDTAALLTFCGSGSGFLVRRYDQMGGTVHQSQTTQANQPRIVNAGVLETLNGKAAPNWTSTSMSLTHTAFDARHVAAVGNMGASAPPISTLVGSVSAVPTGQLRRAGTAADGWRAASSASDYPVPATTWINGTVPSSTDQGGGLFHLADPLGAARVWQFEFNTLRNFDIAGNDAVGTRGYIGLWPEVIYFSATLSTAQRQALEANQGAYWGITINP